MWPFYHLRPPPFSAGVSDPRLTLASLCMMSVTLCRATPFMLCYVAHCNCYTAAIHFVVFVGFKQRHPVLSSDHARHSGYMVRYHNLASTQSDRMEALQKRAVRIIMHPITLEIKKSFIYNEKTWQFRMHCNLRSPSHASSLSL